MVRRFTALALFAAWAVACASGEQVDPPLDTVPIGDGGSIKADVLGPCPECEDNNACTRDLCLAAGGCAHEAQAGQACDDRDGCTSDDRCDAGGVCKGKDAADWIYRFKHTGKGSYYYSRSQTNPPQGYGFDKKLFRILRTDAPNSKPLYRLFSAKQDEFMLSVEANEAAACCGYQNNGVIGHYYPKVQANTVKLHRLKKVTTVLRHLSTLDQTEGGADGFSFEYTQGHVCQ